MISVSAYQPFTSRLGQDTVLKLTFPYDAVLVSKLKHLLRKHKDQAIDPERHIFQPGGWRPQEKCWFVERSIWPEIRRALVADGYRFQEIAGEDEVAHEPRA